MFQAEGRVCAKAWKWERAWCVYRTRSGSIMAKEAGVGELHSISFRKLCKNLQLDHIEQYFKVWIVF